jgi:uncharacterized SAM-binding protein YcdF (DUF218 family)
MFVVLSKVLPQLVYPFGLIFLLLVFSLILRRHRRWQNGLIITAIAIILVTGNTWVAYSLMRSLEWQYLPPAVVPDVGAIVVLGGGTEAPQYPRTMVELNGASDRIFYAAQLYREGKAPHILLSGGSITWLDSRTTTSADDMASVITQLGVPEDALWLQKQSRNTYEDALYSCQLLKEKGVKHILLVTSAAHMPRSVALFRHQGMEVTPAPTDYSITQAEWDNLTEPNLAVQFLNLFPNISNMGLTTSVVKEYIGMLVYHWRGWM